MRNTIIMIVLNLYLHGQIFKFRYPNVCAIQLQGNLRSARRQVLHGEWHSIRFMSTAKTNLLEIERQECQAYSSVICD